MKRNILLMFCMTAILVMDACTYKREVIIPIIDPSNAIALSQVIVFSTDTKQIPGSLPTSPGCAATNTQILNNPSISLANGGSSVFLPIQYSGTTPITSVFVQIVGADTYFQIPINPPTASGILYVPLSLPSNVINGKFTLRIALAGANNCIAGTSTLVVPVQVTEPLGCSDPAVSGASGITQTIHALNRTKAKVTINYDTFTLPDRIDVYLDGAWIAGTGSSILPPPPLSTCSNPSAGFVGRAGTFTFDVGANNRQVQVYVSGCTGSTTQWTYTLTCN
jgi:hypothetical protein